MNPTILPCQFRGSRTPPRWFPARWPTAVFSLLIVLAGAGCRSIGPGTVPRDQMDYGSRVADAWKEQLLLNIVKSRYGDAPAFLEVASVVAGYSLETGVSIGGEFSPQSLRGDTFIGGGISGKFTDRPTISYAPLTGERFARSLMAPVPLDALWFIAQGGTPLDFLLGLTLQSIAGRQNVRLTGGEFFPRDPAFSRLLELLRVLQREQAADSEVHQTAAGPEIWLRFHVQNAADANLLADANELKTLLGVPLAEDRIRVQFGTLAFERGVVAMRPRSLMQILATLGAAVQIPPAHLAQGGVVVVDSAQVPKGFQVHSGKEKPADPFVAVRYRDAWFWIDRADLSSKTTLTAVTVMFNFLEGTGSKTGPVLTIPTN